MNQKQPPPRAAHRNPLALRITWPTAFHRWHSAPHVREAAQLALAVVGASCLVARDMSMLPSLARLALIVPPLLLLIWLAWRLRLRRPAVRSPLAWPLLVAAGALAISSLVGVAHPDAVLVILIQWGVSALMLFMVIDLLALGWRPALFMRAAALASTAVLLSAASGLLLWWLRWVLLWRPGESLLPVGFRAGALGMHPNLAAMLLNTGLPIAIVSLWGARERAPRLLWSTWLLLAVLALFFTSSRGGWVAAAVIVAVTCAPLLWSDYRAGRRRHLLGTLLLIGGYGALFTALFFSQRGEVLAQHGGGLLHPVGRFVFWRRALLLFLEHPLAGAGPAGYATSYRVAESSSRLFVAEHAHSLYLTALSEQGLLGIVALLFLALSALALWWRCWRATPPALPHAGAQQPRLLLLAGLGALAGMAVHGLVDTPRPLIAGLVLCIFAVGLSLGECWQLNAPISRSGKHSGWGARAPSSMPGTGFRFPSLPAGLLGRAVLLHATATLATLLAWGGYSVVSRQAARWRELRVNAGAALQRGEPRRAVQLYGQAIALRPSLGPAYSERAVALAALAGNDPPALRAALAAQDEALLRDPANRSAPLNRAMLLARLGQPAQAEAELRAFIAADTSSWGLPYLLLAHLREQAGDTAAARALWRRALDLQPELSESAACSHSPVCPALAPPMSAYGDTVAARRLVDAADTQTLRWIERQADRWESVDLWAVGALAAGQAGDSVAERRFLQAAQDQSQLIGHTPTPQLGIVLLKDALHRRDRDELRALLRRWTAPAGSEFVPQITELAVTSTEQQLAQTALEAATWLGEAVPLSHAQAFARTTPGTDLLPLDAGSIGR
jgi:O-antigen ligase